MIAKVAVMSFKDPVGTCTADQALPPILASGSGCALGPTGPGTVPSAVHSDCLAGNRLQTDLRMPYGPKASGSPHSGYISCHYAEWNLYAATIAESLT